MSVLGCQIQYKPCFKNIFFVEERVLIIHYSDSGEEVEKVENLLTNEQMESWAPDKMGSEHHTELSTFNTCTCN